jgi:hypothetical protein
MKFHWLIGAGIACALAWPGAGSAAAPESRVVPVHRGAALWNRPGNEGKVLELLPRDSTVQLLDHASNARGLWWYVDSPRGHGWLRDTDFAATTAAARRRLGLLPAAPRAGGPVCRRAARGGGAVPTPMRTALPQQR